jgi:hypothetical protein
MNEAPAIELKTTVSAALLVETWQRVRAAMQPPRIQLRWRSRAIRSNMTARQMKQQLHTARPASGAQRVCLDFFPAMPVRARRVRS